jgi:hypothetical protein
MSFAPSRDGQRTFQSLDDNPRWKGIPDLEDAGPRAIMMYFRTYGPATSDHIHHWLGSGLSAGRKRLDRWLSELGDRLVAVDVDGCPAYVASEDVESLTTAHPSDVVRFLPGHDQWVMGPGTKDSHVTPSTQRQAVTRKANPVIVGGVVRGTWATKGDQLTVTWLDSTQRPPPWKAFEAETGRVAGILDRDLHPTLIA